MVNKSLTKSCAIVAATLTAGCGGGLGDYGGEAMTILDAAAAYEANLETVNSVRGFYPGPYREFSRVPNRNPAEQTSENKAFLKQLRQQFPVAYIDFFPMGDTGKDEIDIILTKYGANRRWTLVSLVYVGVPLPQPEEGKNMAVFDACDQRSIEWLDQNATTERAEVFCRLSETWYAYQRVE